MRGFVILAFFAAVIITALCLLIKMSLDSKREREKQRVAEADRREALSREMAAEGALCAASLFHVRGLPMEGSVPCVCCAGEDGFVFVRNELRVSLPFEKIVDAVLTTRRELRESGRLNYAAGLDGDLYLAMIYRRDAEADESAFFYCGYPGEARELLEVFNKSPRRVRSVTI